jgi:hypothetical protein
VQGVKNAVVNRFHVQSPVQVVMAEIVPWPTVSAALLTNIKGACAGGAQDQALLTS